MKMIDKICVGFYKAVNLIGGILIIALELLFIEALFLLIGGALLIGMPYLVLRLGFEMSQCHAVIITFVLDIALLLIFGLVKIYQHGKSVNLGLNDLEDDERFKEATKAINDAMNTMRIGGDSEDEK